jgi:hypothetical protein
MLAVEYYWGKAGEALAKADVSPFSECFVSIAMIYQTLARGENDLQRRFPNIPPRQIEEGHLARLTARRTRQIEVASPEIPEPQVARGWGLKSHRFDAVLSRVVPERP